MLIHTPDQRVRVFVSSTLGELAAERQAVRAAVARLRLAPVMFELGARPHPPRELYRAYLAQSHVFVGMYWQRYGWVAPGETVSGLEDEYRLSAGMPKLLYIKEPAPDREPRLQTLLDDIRDDDQVSYRRFGSVEELEQLVADDLSLLLSERFETGRQRDSAPDSTRVAVVPRPLTPTVGRDDDQRAAVAALRGGARLVTVTGPGGIGKSRLAAEVALAVADDYPDGAQFVALATVGEPGLVAITIAERLGIRVEGARRPLDALADHFASRRALLVLDNLEQVSAVGPQLVSLLERAPGLVILATSRHPLQVSGEQEHLLGPLDVPHTGSRSADAIAMTAAVQLFVARARDVHTGFALTDDNAQAVAELCRRLDGLPLALELAAARVRLLSPAALLQRLGDHLDLRSGRTDLPERQRTLRATIDWSYEFLDEAERTLFARFSVFVGGATLDAVEQVCGGTGPAVLDTLGGLVDKSLVLVVAADDPGGTPLRVRMLETVRSYAREKLVERGEADLLRDRHLAYFARLGRQAQPYLCGPGQREWCARLDPDQPNIRAAMNASLETDRISTALQLAWDTFVFYYIRDAFQEPREWIQRIAAHRHRLDAVDQARLDVGLVIADVAPDVVDDRELLQSAAQVLETHGLERAVSYFYLGLAHWGHGDADAAIAALRTSSRGYDALAHDWGVATAETALGAILTAIGSDDAAAHHEEALERARRIDNGPLIVQALQGLALLDVLADRTDDALARFDQAARVVQTEQWAAGATYCLDALAVLTLRLGDVEGGIRALASSDAVRTSLGTPGWTAFDQVVHPIVARARGALSADDFAALWEDGRHRDPFSLLEVTLDALRSRPVRASVGSDGSRRRSGT